MCVCVWEGGGESVTVKSRQSLETTTVLLKRTIKTRRRFLEEKGEPHDARSNLSLCTY